MSANKQLKKMLEKGPVTDLFKAEQAESYLKATSKYANKINSHKFREFFVTHQSFAIEIYVISVTKIFEPKNRIYQINSIPVILEFIIENASNLQIEQPYLLQQQIDLDIDLKKITAGLKGEELTLSICKYYEINLPNIDTSKSLRSLKDLRDKYYVHSENINLSELEKTSWESTTKLLEYAQRFIGLIGNGYLSLCYTFPEGKYVLSKDADRIGRMSISVLKELEIV